MYTTELIADAERRENTLDPFVKNSTLVAPSAFFAAGFHQNGNMESAGDAFGWRAPRAYVMSGGCERDMSTSARARDEPRAYTHTDSVCVEKTRVLCAGGEIKSGDA